MLYFIFKLYKNHYDFWRNPNNTPAQKLAEQERLEDTLTALDAIMDPGLKRFIDPSRISWVARGNKAY